MAAANGASGQTPGRGGKKDKLIFPIVPVGGDAFSLCPRSKFVAVSMKVCCPPLSRLPGRSLTRQKMPRTVASVLKRLLQEKLAKIDTERSKQSMA